MFSVGGYNPPIFWCTHTNIFSVSGHNQPIFLAMVEQELINLNVFSSHDELKFIKSMNHQHRTKTNTMSIPLLNGSWKKLVLPTFWRQLLYNFLCFPIHNFISQWCTKAMLLWYMNRMDIQLDNGLQDMFPIILSLCYTLLLCKKQNCKATVTFLSTVCYVYKNIPSLSLLLDLSLKFVILPLFWEVFISVCCFFLISCMTLPYLSCVNEFLIKKNSFF